MTTINLLDVIKSNPITRTIWINELTRTEDNSTLRLLLSAYMRVSIVNLYAEVDTDYKSFYDAVLLQFEQGV